MASTIIPQLIYHLYNLCTGDKLQSYYRQLKRCNEEQLLFNNSKVQGYLRKWGFNEVLTVNPLMTKLDIKSRLSSVDPEKVKSWAFTGGSYGEPLRVPYSKSRSLIRTATFKYFNEIGGYSLGDPFVLIRAKSRHRLLKYMRNEEIFIPNDISEPKIKEFIEKLRSSRIKVLMGYPTVMYELALFLTKFPEFRKGLHLQALISVSEPLEHFKRELIQEVFNCSFIDRYSNEEVGLIAQQKEFGGEYFVNRFGVVTEVVDADTLLPVKEGEIGKVVVTDLCNDLIPVVRYDTGDLAMAHRYNRGQLISIKNIQGRVSEQIFATNGNAISSLILGPYIYKPLAKVGPVFQYQFAQVGSNQYELRLKAEKGDLQEEVLTDMHSNLTNVLGNDSILEVVYLKDIKPQPSGKRPVFKNEYSLK